MSSKFLKTGLATAAALAALVTAAPMAAQAQANGVTNCDAPGGRQRAGAGAAAGSYIGCNQQRARVAAEANANTYRAGTTLRIRSGPGTGFRQSGSLAAGQPFTAVARQGDWIQIAGGGWVNANYVTR